jgi:hypothetical protein
VNTAYIGQVVWNRRTMGKFHRIADRQEVERDGCGRRRLKWNAPEDRLVHENAHEPLVEKELLSETRAPGPIHPLLEIAGGPSASYRLINLCSE